MNRLLFFAGMTFGGYIGWWAAESLGFDLMGAFLISSLGSMVGIFIAWRILVDYFD